MLNPQKLSFGNGKNPNDNIAIIPLTTMMAMHPEFKDFTLFLKATDAQYVPIVVDEVRDYLRRARRLPSNKPDDFAVFTVESFLDLWKQISSGIFVVMMAVGSVALLVGGIGVMNIMLVSVTERTREIGVRKAIGARRSNIMMQFLLEAVLLSAVGRNHRRDTGFSAQPRRVRIFLRCPRRLLHSGWCWVLASRR